MIRRQRGWFLTIAVGILSGLSGVRPAQAAETVILKYSILRSSVPVSELTQLAETGTLSPGLDAQLKLAKQDPSKLRQQLTQTVKINPLLADRVLNSPIGDTVLDQLSQAIYPPTGVANKKALRAALSLSAQDDGNVSILEVLQKYPTQEVLIDGDRIMEAFEHLRTFSKQIRHPFGIKL